jgi:hypothetical protein
MGDRVGTVRRERLELSEGTQCPKSRVSGKFPGPDAKAQASYRESRFHGTHCA